MPDRDRVRRVSIFQKTVTHTYVAVLGLVLALVFVVLVLLLLPLVQDTYVFMLL